MYMQHNNINPASACKFSLITSSKHSNIHVEYRYCDGQGAEIRLNINESILFVFDRAQK